MAYPMTDKLENWYNRIRQAYPNMTKQRRRFKHKVKKLPKKMADGKISVYQAESMINSWMNHYMVSNNLNFIKHILIRYTFIKVKQNHKNKGAPAIFYIDEEEFKNYI